jgi:hypothetical protein
MKQEITHRPVRIGVFTKIGAADRAVTALVDAGIDKEHITVICPTCTGELEQYRRAEPAGAHAPAAAAGGGAIGALLGGLIALVGVAATGGMSLLAAGPLIAGAGGGAVAGGFLGAMLTRGMEKETANYYDQALQRGDVLVAVEEHGDDQGSKLALAESVLAAQGARPMKLREG